MIGKRLTFPVALVALLAASCLRDAAPRAPAGPETAARTAPETLAAHPAPSPPRGVNAPQPVTTPEPLAAHPPTEAGAPSAEATPANPGPARIDFASQVQPLLEGCRPCHFEGGKMYEELPFDDPGTVLTLGEALFTRIKEAEAQALIRAFLAQEEG